MYYAHANHPDTSSVCVLIFILWTEAEEHVIALLQPVFRIVSFVFVGLKRSRPGAPYMAGWGVCSWYVYLSIKTFQEPNGWGWGKGMCVFRACRLCTVALMVLLVLLVDNTGWDTKGVDFSEMRGLVIPWNFAVGGWGVCVCTHHVVMSILSREM